MDYIEKLGEVDIKTEGRIIVEEIKENPKVVTKEEIKKEEVKSEEIKVEVPLKEKTYIVKTGDVLWKIAKQFGKTWQELAKYNKLKNPHLIFPGQKLLIPIK